MSTDLTFPSSESEKIENLELQAGNPPVATPNRMSMERWVDAVVTLTAAVASIVIVGFTLPQGVNQASVTLASAMGLLGSSIFLLYQYVNVEKDRSFDRSNALAIPIRLILGPIAGALSYFLFMDSSKELPAALIWVPFTVGFSSELMLGIMNHIVRTIRGALGIDREQNSAGSRTPDPVQQLVQSPYFRVVVDSEAENKRVSSTGMEVRPFV